MSADHSTNAVNKSTAEKVRLSKPHMRRLLGPVLFGAPLATKSLDFSMFTMKSVRGGHVFGKLQSSLSSRYYLSVLAAGMRSEFSEHLSETTWDAKDCTPIVATTLSILCPKPSQLQSYVFENGNIIGKHHDTQHIAVSPHSCSRLSQESRSNCKPRHRPCTWAFNATCTCPAIK